MTITCRQCNRPGADVLGIRVGEVRPGSRTAWRPLHGQCFDEHGFTYGIAADDLAARGPSFWLKHIGGKTWAEYTDYATAVPRFAQGEHRMTLTPADAVRPANTRQAEVGNCAPDCDERTNCERVGIPGHWQCGACPEHGKPRHHCGCLAYTPTLAARRGTAETGDDDE